MISLITIMRGMTGQAIREAIPYTARIVGITDAWDAMTSDRSYRRALSFEDALAELQRGAGTQFDPYMVKAFINMVKDPFTDVSH